MRKELKVKTPLEAIEKGYELDPEILKEEQQILRLNSYHCRKLSGVLANNLVKLNN